MQGGSSIQGPSAAPEGGTFTVEVGAGYSSVAVFAPGLTEPVEYPVAGGTQVTITVPDVPAGTILIVSVGEGLNTKAILVEVIGTV